MIILNSQMSDILSTVFAGFTSNIILGCVRMIVKSMENMGVVLWNIFLHRNVIRKATEYL